MVVGHKCFPQEKEGLLGMQACEEVLKGSKGKEEKRKVTATEPLQLLQDIRVDRQGHQSSWSCSGLLVVRLM